MYAYKSGTWNLTLPGNGDTPALSLKDLEANTILRVSANFMGSTYGQGFYYRIQQVENGSQGQATAITPGGGVYQNKAPVWRMATIREFYSHISLKPLSRLSFIN